MYKDRIPSPHHLSYSAVTSYQSNGMDSSQFSPYPGKEALEKYSSSNRTSLKVEPNSDLAFLRNTVGPLSLGQPSFLKVNDNKKTDSSLRQTMNITSNVKDFLRVQGQYPEKRSSRAQTVGQLERKRRNQGKEDKKEDRLEKIMEKYEKKNETKQALKLLQELKELKRKQEQLKKQRKNEGPRPGQKPIQNVQNFTGNGLEPNSPLNFSKKNKIEYLTPSYQNKSLSTNTDSSQNQNYFNGRTKKQSYETVREEISININSQPYHKPSQQISLTSAVEALSMSSHPSKSTSNLRTYYEPPHDFAQSKPFSKQEKKQFLSSSTVGEPNFSKEYRPVSPYKVSNAYSTTNHSVLSVTTRDNANFSKSPTHKYKENPSYLSNSVSYNSSKYNSKYDTYPSSSFSSTPLKDVFLNKRVTIDDFVLGKNLGEGKFGTVYQAFDKRTKSIYALKKIPKSVIKSHWMVDQFMLEVKIQNFCNHPNILSLHGVFDDAENVYILLEYMQQGTLFLHLKKNSTLCEKQAAIKIKEVASAIQYLHQNGIAHRDLKPQNIVMSHGVCKLCDFGWATICDQRRKTYCGTFDYAAPEILQGEQYDMSVDLWCLGILTYEVLVGKAPFYHISRKETMKKIMNVSFLLMQCQNEKITYPSSMSYEARSFIEQLLKRNPDERLKSEDLLKHPFILLADK